MAVISSNYEYKITYNHTDKNFYALSREEEIFTLHS
jgi:hypothetical protein